MQHRTSPRHLGTVAVALATALALIVHGCGRESPTVNEPSPRGALSASATSTLDVQGTGSTANGAVSSKDGGIACTITYVNGGVTRSGTCTKSYPTGTVITLTAAPASGQTLSHWSGCTQSTDSPLSCEVTMDTSRTVTAVFAPAATMYTLTIGGGAGGSGRVTSSPSAINCAITNGTAATTGCSASFTSGTKVTLYAAAASGSYLKAWAGGGCDATGTKGSLGTCVVTMSSGQRIVISFDLTAVTASLGSWDPPISWPAVGIDASVLPDGRVLTWGRSDHVPVLWNPATGAFASTAAPPADAFCGGHAFLPSGQLLVAGGHSGINNQGLRASEIFDYTTNAWTPAPAMRNGRWYPTNTTLPTGEILTVSGGDTTQQRNLIPEVYQADGTWRELTTASLFLPYYPFMFVLPNGRVYAAGSSKSTYFLDPSGTGKWTVGPSSNYGSRDYGSAVMYSSGKILMVGGGGPTRTAEVIDVSSGTGAWRYTSSMSVARRQENATILADGRVLVTGGTNATGFNNVPTSDAVLAAEMWDPSTEQWTTLARQSHYRLYHSSAILLPDGRVLSVGSGQPAATGLSDDYTAEIFNPPYLFNADGTKATRPTITSAPTAVSYGSVFTVQTPNASSIAKVTIIRLGSVTHAFDQSQRVNKPGFVVSGTSSIRVNAPSGPTYSPPGYYLLFILDGHGVPSVGKIFKIS